MLFANQPEGNAPAFTIYDNALPDGLLISEHGVGIGIYPTEPLEIMASDGTYLDEARIVVRNAKSEVKARTMLELMNTGPARLILDNTDSGNAWAMLTGVQDQLMLSASGTGGPEVIIKRDGSVMMGPGKVINFKLSNNGNLTIKGTLNQQSDRNSKTAFEKVDAQTILDGIKSLPINSWQYKDDASDVRHLGPTSQDFRAAFRLGNDEKSISAIDADGVALAAIKALSEQLDEKSSRIEELEKRLAAIEGRVRQD